MKVSLVDMRRNPKPILEAVKRQETVILSKRGKPIARIAPLTAQTSGKQLDQHPAFGMWKDRAEVSVNEQVRNLRKGRFHDL